MGGLYFCTWTLLVCSGKSFLALSSLSVSFISSFSSVSGATSSSLITSLTYTVSCLARMRLSARSFNHHCSLGSRCLDLKGYCLINYEIRQDFDFFISDFAYSKSACSTSSATGVNVIWRRLIPITTAEVADFS